MKLFPRRAVNLNKKIIKGLLKIITEARLIRGPEISIFAEEFSKYTGSKKSFGVNSARMGLYLALKAFNFKENDEVIMPAYTFFAMPLIAQACNLKPVFVDSDPCTYNIDVSLIEKQVNKRTKAIFVSHLFGQPAEMDSILGIARKYNLRLIEDCAHSLGAEYKNKKVGSIGDIGIFSFGMGKATPCFGGGMVTVNNQGLIENIQRTYDNINFPATSGILKKILFTCFFYSITSKQIFPYILYPSLRLASSLRSEIFDRLMQESGSGKPVRESSLQILKLANLQSAVGLMQLQRLDIANNLRVKNAKLLSGYLGQAGGIIIPSAVKDTKHIYLYYRVRVKNRKAFRERLLSRGIDSKNDDMSVCPQLKIFSANPVSCPVALSLVGSSMEIPCSQNFNEEDISYIAGHVLKIARELNR